MRPLFRFTTHRFRDPLFPWIPEGFVITTDCPEGRRRVRACLRQLRQCPLCAKMTVVCAARRRDDPRLMAAFDSIDAALHFNYCVIFERFGDEGVCLVLEDDMIILPHIREFAATVESGVSRCDVYSLGCSPLLTIPEGRHHLNLVLACGTVANVYTARARAAIRSWPHNRERGFMNWGLYDARLYRTMRALTPRRPLIVQPFARTANRKEWSNAASDLLIRCLKGEEDPEHFHSVLYGVPLGVLGLASCVVLGALVVVVAVVGVAWRKRGARLRRPGAGTAVNVRTTSPPTE